MKGYRIVVADSSESSRQKISNLLKRKGYKVYHATDGAGAIRTARSIRPDIVILDTNLWGINAYEVADIIEGDKLSIVIFSTNRPDSDLYSYLKKMTLYAYITKPFNPEQVYQILEFVIMNSGRIHSLSEKIEKLEHTLESRKIIDKAKGLVMEKLNISENEAYGYIRKKSMDLSLSMEKMAQRIIKEYFQEHEQYVSRKG